MSDLGFHIKEGFDEIVDHLAPERKYIQCDPGVNCDMLR